jgi:hypothetical protein
MNEPTPTTGTPRRQIVLLAALLATLGALIVWALMPSLSGSGSGRAPAPPAASGEKRPAAAPLTDVKLEKLTAGAQEPNEGGRNPFRMGAAPRPPASDGPPRPAGPVAPPVDPGPPPPPPVPPIPFRFIGILTGPAGVGRIAVLSDGKVVVHGKEGAEIEGRYRIVKIGEESLQIEHVDGRGRQTIRLSGSPTP